MMTRLLVPMKKPMQTLSQSTSSRTPTTEMEVTSIRLERDLKDQLKQLAGHQGYQALIRDILWAYVEQQQPSQKGTLSLDDIRATMPATAMNEERCVLSGDRIQPQDPILLGWTTTGTIVPISPDSVPSH